MNLMASNGAREPERHPGWWRYFADEVEDELVAELVRRFKLADPKELRATLARCVGAVRLREMRAMLADPLGDHQRLKVLVERLDDALSMAEVPDISAELLVSATSQEEDDHASIELLEERLEHLLTACRELRDLAQTATSRRPKRGRPVSRNEAREIMRYLAEYWMHVEQRKFTRDFDGNEPISYAAQFVVAATAGLASVADFLTKECVSLDSLMKDEISRRRSGGKTRQNSEQ